MARSPSEQPSTSNMKPVSTAAPLVGAPALPAYPPAPNPYLRTPLPPQHQLQPDTLRQFYQTGFPQTRIVPLPPTANATINASAHGIAKAVATQIAKLTQAPVSIKLTMPPEYSVSGSPANATGEFDVTWKPESSGTIFAAPPAVGLIGFDAAFSATGNAAGAATATTTGGTPSQSGEWALYCGWLQGTSFTANPAGWTPLAGSSLVRPQLVQQIPSGATSVSVSQSYTGPAQWSSVLAYFGGTLPTFIQSNQTQNGGISKISASFTSATGAGHDVLVILTATLQSGQNPFLPSAFDTQGLTPYFIGSAAIPNSFNLGGGSQTTVFLFQGTSNAAETVTLQFPHNATAVLTIYEITALSAVSAVPRFIPTPPVNVSNATGILSILNGGAGVSLATTGGTSQVLMQESAGATITVRTLAFADISGAATGTPSASNFLRGDGSWSATGELGVVNLTAQNANIGATTLFAVPATGAGMYSVHAYVIETTADAASSTLPNVQILYTDVDTGAVITIDATPILAAAGLGQTGALGSNAVGTTATGVIGINAKASTNIQYQTVNYASGTAGVMKYSVHLRLEAL